MGLVLTAPALSYGQKFVEAPAGLADVQCAAPVTGDVVYGQIRVGSTLKAVRWSPGESSVVLLNPSDPTTEIVNGTSGDGSVAVGGSGQVGPGGSGRAFRYVHAPGGGEVETLEYAGDGFGTQQYAEAICCSLDGEIVFGNVKFSNYDWAHSFRWSESEGFQVIPRPSDGYYSQVMTCSDDGAFVAGKIGNTGFTDPFMYSPLAGGWKTFDVRAFYGAYLSGRGSKVGLSHFEQSHRWVQGVYEPVPRAPGAGDGPIDFISVDGDAVAGRSGGRAYRWTPHRGTEVIGTLGGNQSYPRGITARGKFVVGNAQSVVGSDAFLWSQEEGIAPLQTVAENQLPDDPNLEYWRFAEPTVSRDGRHFFIEGERIGVRRVAYLNLEWLDGGDVNHPPQIQNADVEEGETVTVRLGDSESLEFLVTDQDPQDDIVVTEEGLREGVFDLHPDPDLALDTDGLATLAIGNLRRIDVGTHDVSLTFTDSYGDATTRSFKIEVPPNQPPSADPIVATRVECEGDLTTVTLTTHVRDDDGQQKLRVDWFVNGVFLPGLTQTGLSPGDAVTFSRDLPHDEHEIRCVVTDSYDTSATTATVTISDTTAPVISAATVVVGTDPGENFATSVDLGAPSIIELCDKTPEVTSAPLSKYELGENLVKWTIRDDADLESEFWQKVVVEDREAPVIARGSNIRANVDRGKSFATVSLEIPEATDNVDEAVVVTSDHPSKRFKIGRNSVTWTARDAAGKESFWKQTVTVLNARPTANAGPDIVVETTSPRGASVNLDARRSSDPDKQKLKYEWSTEAKGVRLRGQNQSEAAGSFPVGKNMTVKLTVTDLGGLKHTDSVRVTVILKNGKKRPRGEQANDAFAETAGHARDNVATGGGANSHRAYAYGSVAASIGIVAGDAVVWDDADSQDDAMIAYSALRNAQRTYGRQAALAAIASYVESGDDAAFRVYASALDGLANAEADLIEE